jgi:hypothetical protein
MKPKKIPSNYRFVCTSDSCFNNLIFEQITADYKAKSADPDKEVLIYSTSLYVASNLI